jgi:hypothetical protein
MPVEHLGDALFTARTLRQLTLRDVAAGAGVPASRLVQYERGVAIPGPADFWKVWDYLSSDPPRRSPAAQGEG